MAKNPHPPEPTSLVKDEHQANTAWLNEEPEARETRGEKKRRATQLERLGESLVELTPAKLARVPMPDDLAAAVKEAQRISARGGYRRQVQLIGKIMRTVDAQPIADALERMNDEDAPSARSFKEAELWRARLIAEGDKALEDLVKERPQADRTLLRQLLRKKPPHGAKELFRELKRLFDPPALG